MLLSLPFFHPPRIYNINSKRNHFVIILIFNDSQSTAIFKRMCFIFHFPPLQTPQLDVHCVHARNTVKEEEEREKITFKYMKSVSWKSESA